MQSENDVPRFLRLSDLQERGIAMTHQVVVCNKGRPIPDSARERLFQPFSRGDMRPSQQGLGLGLYIASEIAKAHGGKIDVASTVEETCFTFTMPLKPN